MDKRQGRVSTKMIILIPVFILGIVSIISNVAAVGNIQRVNSNGRQIADGHAYRNWRTYKTRPRKYINRAYLILLPQIWTPCLCWWTTSVPGR